jgi:hypothetical protein
LTLPFLCAAAIHALVRSDLALLTRAAFGYLPLSLLAVGIASQLTMLLLSGTDEMSSIVASASGHADGVFLSRTSVAAVVASVGTGDPFVAFIAAILTVAAALALWVELLIRDAAVYVIVLMLPLFFAAMVWPARRVLAIRAIETLIALILSKFAIVAVLTLGAAAFGGGASGLSSSLVGATLVVLAVLSPWALLRLLPLHEVAAAAAGGLSHGPRAALQGAGGTVYDAMRGNGAQPDEANKSSGLGIEDDGADALAGMSEYGAWAGARRLAGTAQGSGDSARGVPLRFGAETAKGLSAVEGAGRPGARVAGVDGSDGGGSAEVHRPPAMAVADRADDERPPIDDMFGDVEWEGFVIGEEGDEVMEPPRFAAPSLPPELDDAGAES